jgi:hypothetical protein
MLRKNYGLPGGLASEVQRNYVGFAKPLGSLQQTVKINTESYVQAQPLRPHPRFP